MHPGWSQQEKKQTNTVSILPLGMENHWEEVFLPAEKSRKTLSDLKHMISEKKAPDPEPRTGGRSSSREVSSCPAEAVELEMSTD